MRRNFLPVFCVALLVIHHFFGHGLEDSQGPFAQAGYILRYLAGQTPWLTRKVVHDGKLHLFHIGDFADTKVTDTLVLPKVAQAERRLVEAGVDVVLLPVPTKASIERSFFSDARNDDELFRHIRGIDDKRTVDLLEAFRRHYRERGEALFPANDYHWSSLGVSVAVAETVRLLQSRGWPISEPVLLRDGEQNDGPSYLTRQFLIPDWFYPLRPELQMRSGIYRTQADSRGERPGRIVIAGTSFSGSRDPASLHGQLEAIFHKPVHNFAKQNGGYYGSFERMRDEKFALQAGDLLVWELPVCCLNAGERAIPAVEIAPHRSIASKP